MYLTNNHNQFLKIFYSQMKNRIDKVWTDVNIYPVALYSQKENYVIIVGLDKIPKDFTEKDGIMYGKWDNRFVGCADLDFENIRIAIWNMDIFDYNEKRLIAGLHHEAFHCFQNSSDKWSKQLPNDVLSPYYPLNIENISLREKERQMLLSAMNESNNNKCFEYVNRFVSYRERRKGIINNDFFNYELNVETFEGTALYVETKIINLLGDSYVDKYNKHLGQYPDNFKSFRLSCYFSGSAMCFILDKLNNEWKHDFLKSNKNLYEYLKFRLDIKIIDVDVSDDGKAKELALNEESLRKKDFEDFYKSNGFKITFEGSINLTGFDPMNIICIGKQSLHKHFFRFDFDGSIIQFNQPVVTEISSDNIWDIKRVTVFLQEQPTQIDNDIIKIVNVGKLKGNLINKDDKFIIKNLSDVLQ